MEGGLGLVMHLSCPGTVELTFFLKISQLDQILAQGLNGQVFSQCSIGNEANWE